MHRTRVRRVETRRSGQDTGSVLKVEFNLGMKVKVSAA